MSSDFLASLQEKAQNALKSAGFGGQSDGPSDGHSGGNGGILKSHAFESVQHQLRTLQQTYSSSVSPIQKVITTQKGIALDLDSLSSDSQTHSKELYLWGQQEEVDIKDVTDRLAWINYLEGTLARTLAGRINASRVPFKGLRDAENTLGGRRNLRSSLSNQIGRIEHDQRRGDEQRLADLRKQLRQAEETDEPLEKQVELLKRKAVRESEQQKWQAVREYAEKLILLSQAATGVLSALPTVPSADHKYHGAETTASVHAALEQALDNYKPGDINLPLPAPPSDLKRSDTRSFGETHAQELSRINSSAASQPSIPLTPPPTAGGAPLPGLEASLDSPVSYASAPYTSSPPPVAARQSPVLASQPPAGTQSPPLNPAFLNQAPAPIPVSSGSPAPIVAPYPSEKVPSVTPTVAETGVPQSAGSAGPGPASGSLRDLRQPSQAQAVDDKGYAPYGQKHESAGEEKKRLEREEREKALGAGSSDTNPQPPADGEEPPPYPGSL
ncbi:uncharacterized protein LAESUDRAFT_680526 [Laetiporus sulphureus 93-53]|uniref:Sphingolipid long chain base-responsive protein LSP1 n=1 Tax=Laetiporus sulphureus 93-53 TaxID=1314785 RepID=A0A165DZ40_9APHY|nr:uncharacterized protein LAESUDRAFT_680526 [Laetiporus sulphureus 93-53]KZT05930.1 hypothetical protein LAESUDRAFT_680526 [Laetiporus sulphureus 93-53]